MDLRIRTTRDLIKRGLLDCLQSEKLITLQDSSLIRASGVSSRTFHRYYANKSEVVDDIEANILKTFQKAIDIDIKPWFEMQKLPSKAQARSLFLSGMDELFDCYKRYKDEILKLTSINGDPELEYLLVMNLAKRIQKVLIQYLGLTSKKSTEEGNETPFKLVSIRFARSVISPLKYWLVNQDDLSVSNVKKIISNTILFSPYDLTFGDQLEN